MRYVVLTMPAMTTSPHASRRVVELAVTRAAYLLQLLLVSYSLIHVECQNASQRPLHLGGATWFVQLTDLHINKFNGNPVIEDLQAFASAVLAPLSPSALLVTGDLADSRLPSERSQQQEEEWEGYRKFIRTVLSTTQLKAEDILDLRGNHDTFDSSRGGPTDFFRKYSARALISEENAQQRIHLRRLKAQVPGGSPAACPGALLVGIDPTPDPAFRSPINFLGVVDAALLKGLDSRLRREREQLSVSGCRTTIVAYCHYTLGTMTHAGDAAEEDDGVGRRLSSVLAEHDVAALLNGHLHAIAGPRMHRLLRKPLGGYLAELELSDFKHQRRFRVLAVDAGRLAFADLAFPRISDGVGARYAITSVDSSRQVGGHVVLITQPPDARYAPLSSAEVAEGADAVSAVRALLLPVMQQGSTSTAEVMEVHVEWSCGKPGMQDGSGSMALARSAEDKRLYSAEMASPSPWDECGAGVLFLRVCAREAGGSLSTSEWRPTRRVQQAAGSPAPTHPGAAAPLPLEVSWLSGVVVGTHWPTAADKVFRHLLILQLLLLLLSRLFAAHILSHAHMSSRRGGYVALLPAPPASPCAAAIVNVLLDNNACMAGALGATSPLKGPNLSRRVSGGAECTVSAGSGAPPSAAALHQGHGAALHQGQGAAGMRALRLRVPSAVGAVTWWPLCALALMSQDTLLWLGMVAYTCNQMLGPWLLAVVSSSTRLSVMSSSALWLHMPGGAALSLVRHASADARIIAAIHTATCSTPLLFWLAAALALLTQPQAHATATGGAAELMSAGGGGGGGEARRPAGRCSIGVLAVIASGLALLAVHLRILVRMWACFTWMAVVLSPCMGWTLPLVLLALRRAHKASRGPVAPATRTQELPPGPPLLPRQQLNGAGASCEGHITGGSSALAAGRRTAAGKRRGTAG